MITCRAHPGPGVGEVVEDHIPHDRRADELRVVERRDHGGRRLAVGDGEKVVPVPAMIPMRRTSPWCQPVAGITHSKGRKGVAATVPTIVATVAEASGRSV